MRGPRPWRSSRFSIISRKALCRSSSAWKTGACRSSGSASIRSLKWSPASASGTCSAGSGKTTENILTGSSSGRSGSPARPFTFSPRDWQSRPIVDLYRGHKPESTFWGIVISIVSILSMWALIRAKVKVGTSLNSPAILADAACTRACLQLSVVLLIASAGYRLTGIGGLDSVGALVIGGLCYREGKEALEKAKSGVFACTCGGSCKKEKE